MAEKRSEAGQSGWGCLLILGFLGLFVWMLSKDIKKNQVPPVNNTVTLQIADMNFVPLALEEPDLERILWLDNMSPLFLKKRSDSIKTLLELIEAGKVLKIGDGEVLAALPVETLESKPIEGEAMWVEMPQKVHVKILAGVHEGKVGWVSSRWIGGPPVTPPVEQPPEGENPAEGAPSRPRGVSLALLWAVVLILLAFDFAQLMRLGYGGLAPELKGANLPKPDWVGLASLALLFAFWLYLGGPLEFAWDGTTLLGVTSLLIAAMAVPALSRRQHLLESLPDKLRAFIHQNLGEADRQFFENWRQLPLLRRILRYNTWQGSMLLLLDLVRIKVPVWILLGSAAYTLVGFAVNLGKIWIDEIWFWTWRRNPFQTTPEEYDLFISYKSEDVQVVRQVVDALLAAGKRIWFAEYMILLSRRGEFQKAITAGLERSGNGIAFTNRRYSDSPHCRDELAHLTQPQPAGRVQTGELKLFGQTILQIYEKRPNRPRKLLQVKMPDEPLNAECPGLSGHPALVSTGNVEEILEFIRHNLGFTIANPPAEPSRDRAQDFHGSYNGAPYALNLTGWNLIHQGDGAANGPEFEYRQNNTHIRGRLTLGADAERFVRLKSHKPDLNRQDERAVFDELLETAQMWTAVLGIPCFGVHLFRLAGLSHPVLSFWKESHWERRYPMDLVHHKTNEPVLITFIFGFFGPFREYCRHAVVMDRLVKTLQWHG